MPPLKRFRGGFLRSMVFALWRGKARSIRANAQKSYQNGRLSLLGVFGFHAPRVMHWANERQKGL